MARERTQDGRGGVFCLNCGTVNDADRSLCRQCGFQRARRSDTSTPAAPTRPSPVAPATEYVGFWIRAMAWVIDGILVAVLAAIATSVLTDEEGVVPRWMDALAPLMYLAAAIAMRSETPGKKVLRLQVVDARGAAPGIWRTVVRELPGKLISGVFFGLGFLWAAWDGHKRGWHDYLAGTYVVRSHCPSVMS